MEQTHAYLFPDTNYFEQYRDLRDIDWKRLAETSTVTIVIAQVVLRELNRHKDASGSSRLRKRAQTVIKALRAISSEQSNHGRHPIREQVDLIFLANEPRLDFSTHGLSRDVSDDFLIGSAIEFASAHPESRVSVVSGDFGVQIKVRARSWLGLIELSDNFLLPIDPSDEERKIRELSQELARIKATWPSLRLVGGGDRSEASLEFAKELDSGERCERLCREAAAKFPRLTYTEPTGYQMMGAALVPKLLSMGFPSEAEYDRYNAERDAYLRDLRSWYEACEVNLNRQRLSAALVLSVENSGSAPAEDIQVNLHFPDGFHLHETLKIDIPKRPRPPVNPMNELEKMASVIPVSPIHSGVLTNYDRFLSTVPGLAGPASLKSLKRSRSYDCVFQVTKVGHRSRLTLPELFVEFTTYRQVKTFQIDYRITASNYPDEFEGTLPVFCRVH